MTIKESSYNRKQQGKMGEHKMMDYESINKKLQKQK